MFNLRWPEPALEAGETIALTAAANFVYYGVARGGTLVMTDRRLIFQPNSVEAWLRLKPRSWSRESIAAVGVAKRGVNLFGGAVRRRLRVELTDGTVLRFVVSRADQSAGQISELLKSGEF